MDWYDYYDVICLDYTGHEIDRLLPHEVSNYVVNRLITQIICMHEDRVRNDTEEVNLFLLLSHLRSGELHCSLFQ